MKAVKANFWKLAVIWLGFFLFNLLDFGDRRMVNIFQRDSGNPLYAVFIYYLLADHMALDFILPRLGDYRAYIGHSLKYLWQELLPQVFIMGAGCILLSYPLNIPIEWLGALSFLVWLLIQAGFLGLYEQVLQLSEHPQVGTLAIWLWIIACILIPESVVNLFKWPLTDPTKLASGAYFSKAIQTLVIYFLVLMLTYTISKNRTLTKKFKLRFKRLRP